jgi:hypothetical protein
MLKHRIQVERPRVIQRIQEAIADDSNLAENPEYQAAKGDQDFNEARIADLEDKLARAEVIDVSKLSGDPQAPRMQTSGTTDRAEPKQPDSEPAISAETVTPAAPVCCSLEIHETCDRGPEDGIGVRVRWGSATSGSLAR